MNRLQKKALKSLIASMLGGVAGAVATVWLGRAGLSARKAAIGVTIVGGAGAAMARGVAREVCMGAAAFGASQLVRAWFGALDQRIDEGNVSAVESSDGEEDNKPRNSVRPSVKRSVSPTLPLAPEGVGNTETPAGPPIHREPEDADGFVEVERCAA